MKLRSRSWPSWEHVWCVCLHSTPPILSHVGCQNVIWSSISMHKIENTIRLRAEHLNDKVEHAQIGWFFFHSIDVRLEGRNIFACSIVFNASDEVASEHRESSRTFGFKTEISSLFFVHAKMRFGSFVHDPRGRTYIVCVFILCHRFWATPAVVISTHKIEENIVKIWILLDVGKQTNISFVQPSSTHATKKLANVVTQSADFALN